jgi:hypothetical protein
MAAATELSTPPDIATMTRVSAGALEISRLFIIVALSFRTADIGTDPIRF